MIHTCSVDDCETESVDRTMCQKHYMRKVRHGDPLAKTRAFNPGGWGSWRTDGGGYTYRTRSIGDGKRERQAQHRMVMEEFLGRDLLPEETVHHINGQRSDNRIGNLELWSSRQPQGQRIEDKVAWAIELLREYRPSALKGDA